jgi:hypothetical protein
MIRRHCDSRFVSDSYGDLSFARRPALTVHFRAAVGLLRAVCILQLSN